MHASGRSYNLRGRHSSIYTPLLYTTVLPRAFYSGLLTEVEGGSAGKHLSVALLKPAPYLVVVVVVGPSRERGESVEVGYMYNTRIRNNARGPAVITGRHYKTS